MCPPDRSWNQADEPPFLSLSGIGRADFFSKHAFAQKKGEFQCSITTIYVNTINTCDADAFNCTTLVDGEAAAAVVSGDPDEQIECPICGEMVEKRHSYHYGGVSCYRYVRIGLGGNNENRISNEAL